MIGGTTLAPLDPYWLASLPEQADVFDEYRSRDPVHWGRPLQPGMPGCWYLTRYDDVVSVIRSDRVGHARPRPPSNQGLEFERDRFTLNDVLDRWFVFMDGSEHVRLRSVLAKPLRKLAGPETRDAVERLSHQLIDRFASSASIDLLPAFTYPFPVVAVAHLIGFPEADHARLIKWAQTFIQVFDLRSDEVVARVRDAFSEFFRYMHERLDERNGFQGDDLLGVLVAARDRGTITHDELMCTAALLLLAGAETTPTLIGNSVWLLLTHPDALAAFRTTSTLTETAVDEVMRFESPVQLTGRHALVDFELRGKTIHKGDYVVALYGAANRDPAQFPEPHVFDVRRTPNRHLGFGVGVHACVGGAVGHLLGQVAVRTLLDRFPDMQLESPAPDWRGHGSIRGLRSLNVKPR